VTKEREATTAVPRFWGAERELYEKRKDLFVLIQGEAMISGHRWQEKFHVTEEKGEREKRDTSAKQVREKEHVSGKSVLPR